MCVCVCGGGWRKGGWIYSCWLLGEGCVCVWGGGVEKGRLDVLMLAAR